MVTEMNIDERRCTALTPETFELFIPAPALETRTDRTDPEKDSQFLPNKFLRLVGKSGSAAAVTLLSNGELDSLTLGERDPGLLLTDDEDVGKTGGEGVVDGVLDVDNVESSVVTLTVGDYTDTSHVTSSGDHGDGSGVEADDVNDLSGLEVDLDGVVDTDDGVGVTDGAGVVGDEVGDSLLSELDTLDLAKLVGGLGVGDAVDGETSLGVVDETEVLSGLLDRDDVHESGGVGRVGADLSVDLDQALHDDGLDLTVAIVRLL
jgi:hypothetical protein